MKQRPPVLNPPPIEYERKKKMGRNSHYFKGKEENAKRALGIYESIERDKDIMDAVRFCVNNSCVYSASPLDKDRFISKERSDKPFFARANKLIINLDTVSAIEKVYNEYPRIYKMAALNFASYKNPGGMFLKGSKAQEECLCHQSALYNILSRFPKYYEENKKNLNNALYTDRAIYTPSVPFFTESSIFNCDIITCAAPNKYAAQKYKNVSDEENWYNLYNRIEFILNIAKFHQVDILIVGAFGCGVFGQDPYEVAAIFKYLLDTKPYGFSQVIFAIPRGTRADNYTPFEQIFFNPTIAIDNPRIRSLLRMDI